MSGRLIAGVIGPLAFIAPMVLLQAQAQEHDIDTRSRREIGSTEGMDHCRLEPGLQQDGDQRLARHAEEAIRGLALHRQIGVDWWRGAAGQFADNGGSDVERDVGEDTEVRFERGEQSFVQIHIEKASDQSRIAAQAVGERIVLEPLLFHIEEERRRFQAEVESMRSDRVSARNGADQSEAQQYECRCRVRPRSAG